MDQVPAGPQAGQISADGAFQWDGQQWVPLAKGHREPTSWTRPMQLIAAGLFALSGITGLITTILFVNHDSVLKAIHAQGTQIPAGTDIDTIINFTIGITWAIAVVFTVLWLVAALGSYLGWRWMFWAALVLFGISGIGAFTNLGSLFSPDKSPVPVGGLILSEIFAVGSIALFVWMLVGLIKYGPWAMRRPGR
jgi:flagellar biosynthesis protein FlhB